MMGRSSTSEAELSGTALEPPSCILLQVMDRVLFLPLYDPSARRAGHVNKREKNEPCRTPLIRCLLYVDHFEKGTKSFDV